MLAPPPGLNLQEAKSPAPCHTAGAVRPRLGRAPVADSLEIAVDSHGGLDSVSADVLSLAIFTQDGFAPPLPAATLPLNYN